MSPASTGVSMRGLSVLAAIAFLSVGATPIRAEEATSIEDKAAEVPAAGDQPSQQIINQCLPAADLLDASRH